jgi:hypothetical protein
MMIALFNFSALMSLAALKVGIATDYLLGIYAMPP